MDDDQFPHIGYHDPDAFDPSPPPVRSRTLDLILVALAAAALTYLLSHPLP